jgi:hypothetical protein
MASSRVYDQVQAGNNLLLELADPKSSKTERMLLSMEFPEVLNKHRPLTATEQQASGYIMLGDEKVLLKSRAGKKEIELGFCRYLSPLVISKEPGLWTKLRRLRYILADPEFIDFVEKSYPSLALHRCTRGTCHDLGVTVIPGHQSGGIHLSPAARTGSETLREVHVLMAEIHRECLELAGLKVDFSKHWAANASVTVGHHDNRDFTGAQVNYTKEAASLDNTLKCKAHVHVDLNDDPARFTVLPFLGTFSDKTYPGLMNITSAKLSCSCQPMGVLVFTGRQPHASSGYGAYEPNFDVRSMDISDKAPAHMYQELPAHFFKGRINLPMYCRNDNIQARAGEVADEIWGEKALAVFGTRRNHQTWKLRFHIKQHLKEFLEKGITAAEVCEWFCWQNDEGEIEHPDLAVAQLCLQYAGKTVKEYDEVRKAAIYAACGTRIPDLDDDGSVKQKRKTRKVVDDQGQEVDEEYEKIQCEGVSKSSKGQCKSKFWPELEGERKCKRHRTDM